jgi:hypothetical protein
MLDEHLLELKPEDLDHGVSLLVRDLESLPGNVDSTKNGTFRKEVLESIGRKSVNLYTAATFIAPEIAPRVINHLRNHAMRLMTERGGQLPAAKISDIAARLAGPEVTEPELGAE